MLVYCQILTAVTLIVDCFQNMCLLNGTSIGGHLLECVPYRYCESDVHWYKSELWKRRAYTKELHTNETT